MKKTLLFTLLMLLGAGYSYAQRVTGKVTSKEDGKPLPFVTVVVKGFTSATTSTNDNGEYSINVPAGGEVLSFSFFGMKSQDVRVGGRAVIDVILESEENLLTETVVTAMGIKRERKALGYAVQDLKGNELLKNKDANIINSLNGKIAGVNVTNSGGAPGESSSIIIRGGTSLERDNQPLFIIDGIPMDNSTGQGDNSAFDGSTNSSTTNSNRAMDINPEDIESISILKGPAAAALYGLRAAAGAVVITTRKGQEGVVAVNFNSRFTMNWVNKLPKQQATFQQGSYYKSSTLITQTMYSWGDPFAPGQTVYDNVGDFFETAYGYDNSINVSGGSKTGNFYLSASNLIQKGIVPTTDFNKTTFRFNGEQKLGIFTFGANASYSLVETSKTLTGSGLWGAGGGGTMESLFIWPRNDNMSVYLNEDGTKRRLFPNQELRLDKDNPYWNLNKKPQSDKTNRLIGAVYTNIDVTSWMKVMYKLGYDTFTSQFRNYISAGSGVKEAWQKGMLGETDKTYEYINSNLMLSMSKVFAEDWTFDLLLGHSTEDFSTRSNSLRAENFVIPGFISLNNAAHENQYLSQSTINKRLIGVFGDFRVAYKNIAYIGVTGRNDWSSTLPKQNRSFFYPSVSASFIFSSLLPQNSILSFGKLRASWAQVGKDAPPYQTKTYLFGPELTIGGGFRNYWTLGNPNLKPETTTSTEVGVELRFLNNRLGLDVAAYRNKSKDQILQPRVSNATGYILSYVNTGTIVNNGIEGTITGTPVRTNDFTWDIMLNMSHNKGTVKELPGSLPILYVTDAQFGNAKAASFDGGKFMGISGQLWSRNAEGELILNWTTGYPTSDGLQTKDVGNREPILIGGLNNSLTYKGFNLSFLIDFRLKGDIYNGTEWLMSTFGISKTTENRGEKYTFTGVALNPTTKQYEKVSREVVLDEAYYRDIHTMNTPNYIEGVNWLRLRSVSLAYSIPQTLLKKLKYLKAADIVVSGTNLLLLTNYSGMDPEVSAAGAGVVGSGSVGIDYAGVPATTGVSFGLNLKF